MERLLAFPPVHKLLEAARPQLDAAYSTYVKLHDTVVASPRYKQAYDLSLQVGRGEGRGGGGGGAHPMSWACRVGTKLFRPLTLAFWAAALWEPTRQKAAVV